MGFPTVNASPAVGGTVANATTTVVTVPAHVADDLLILFNAHDGVGPASNDGGFTELVDSNVAAVASGYAAALKATGTGPATVTITHPSERSNWCCIVIPAGSWDTSTFPEVGTVAAASSATPNPAAVTASWGSADNLFIAVMIADSGVASAVPTNYSYLTIHFDTFASAGFGCLAFRQLTAATDDPGTFTIPAADDWIAFTIVVKGTASGPTPVTGTAASSFGWSTDASGVAGASGTAASSFGFSHTATATEDIPGVAASAFGFSTSGTGTVATPITAVGDSTFGWSTAGTGVQVENATGVAASSFGFSAAATAVESFSGVAASSFGWSTAATGTEGFSGTAASAFGWSTAGTGTALAPVTGTAASAFGFSTAGAGTTLAPVTGTSASSFTWGTAATGVLTVGVLGVGACAFTWSTAGLGELLAAQHLKVKTDNTSGLGVTPTSAQDKVASSAGSGLGSVPTSPQDKVTYT